MIIIFYFINAIAAVFMLNAYSISKARGNIEKKREVSELMKWIQRYVKKFGITQKSDILLYTLLPFFGVIMGVAALTAGNISAAVVLIVSPTAVILMLLGIRKKSAVSVFQKNAYKLYKYILNQTSAGVRTSDAMKMMYEVVNEKKLRRVLMESCAKYSVTLENEILSKEILENIDTPEARSFAITIRDGLFESRDPRLMERLEQLMFNRYFAYIQRTTDNVKTRCLISVVLLCSVIVVMVLIPTFLDVQNALNSIFTQ